MPVKTLRQILSTNPTPGTWIVDGLLRTGRGRPSLLVGAPHAGKSTLAIQLAKAVATGQSFLGRDTLLSPILFWSSEETLTDLSDEFVQGTSIGDPFHFIEAVSGQDNLRTLSEGLRELPDVRLCIIENLASFFGLQDVKDNSEIERALGSFREATAEFVNCCFVIIHWTRKSDGQGKSLVTNNILGGTSIVGNADTIIGIQQVSDEDQRRIVQAKVRVSKRTGGRRIDPTFLSYDPETATSVLDVTVEESKQEKIIIGRESARSDKKEGLVFLIKNNPYITQNSLYEQTGGNKDNFLNMLDELEASGRIVRTRNQGVRKNETQLNVVVSYDEARAERAAVTAKEDN